MNAGGAVVVAARDATRVYPMPAGDVHALRGIDLVVPAGDYVALMGPSGCGKSTLLNLFGAIDLPTTGTVTLDGRDTRSLDDGARTRLRLTRVGFVFQRFFLLPMLSAYENVLLPMLEARVARAEREARARELLAYVGLDERRDHRPSQLSGGEMQRVAIARALANRPRLLLADEPTGELDTATSHEVFELLRRVNEQLGTTIVIVTHDPVVSEQVQRTVAIRDGRTSTETLRRTELSDDGDHRAISEEFAVLDRAGRLQLPKQHIAALELRNRVRLRLEEDHVGVWPDRNGKESAPK